MTTTSEPYVMHEIPEDLGLEFLRSEVGSTLHGTGLPGGEDRDEMGVYIEWPERVLGFDVREQYIWRSVDGGIHQFNATKSGPGDTDLVVYTLRKWAKLALSANPTVMLILFAPEDRLVLNTPVGRELRANAHWFASKRAGKAFGGYLDQQRARMMGERGGAGRVRRQPDGEPDWKYAMHMLRLGYQGIEFLQTGKITLPIPISIGDHLRRCRSGQLPLGLVMNEAQYLLDQINDLTKKSDLPDEPDVEHVQDFIVRSYRQVRERLPWRS